ncbi:hypothetical protein FOC4_g10003754 [Fusarium odoratissimum]|uniref:Lysozyme-like protein n=1 Tax=Fusarium oxysporum f. sp. cubense (strain race 4) TaxID=2502994 RepID=N1S2R3_FUSC4|nr:hypothetical protein FOC4_g10003754 [Fusarium odoratissimum]
MNSLSLIVLFFGAAMAGIHHNCGCTVRGSYRQDLAQAACALWGSNQPHTHWDGYSCVDKGYGRGIDGAPWETTCKQAWDINFGGNKDDAWASTLLVKFGTGLAGKAGGWVFQEGLAAVTGGTDTERSTSDSLLQIRKDGLRTYITDIETYCSAIGDTMQEAFQIPDMNLTDADRVRQAQGLQKRLDNRLRACSNDVPGYLDQINDFLNEQGWNAFTNRLHSKLSINPMIFLDIAYSGCKLTTSTKPLFIIIFCNL